MFDILYKKRIVNPHIEELKKFGEYSNKLHIKKKILSSNISNLNCSKLLGEYNSFDEINIDELPECFVIKTSHFCGDSRVIKSKEDFKKNYNNLKNHFNNTLKTIYRNGDEPHYKYIKPELFIEEYLEGLVYDYKFHCIHGEVVLIMILNDKTHEFYNYSIDWKPLRVIRSNNKLLVKNIKKPEKLQDMLEIAKKLSKEYDYVRIDLYEINNKIYFGEYTFTPGGCIYPYFQPIQFENILSKFYNEKKIDYDLINKYFLL